MSRFNTTSHEVPGLNTASLPDLIFTVLFFFMIVTHIREVPLKVEYDVPQGTQIEKLTRKSTVTYIYIGKPVESMRSVAGTETRIQLNDKYATVEDIADFISAERSAMAPEDVQNMTVSIKADRDTRMGIIDDVKQVLRSSGVRNVNYSADMLEKR